MFTDKFKLMTVYMMYYDMIIFTLILKHGKPTCLITRQDQAEMRLGDQDHIIKLINQLFLVIILF